MIEISEGSFADPNFLPPTMHFYDETRPRWLAIHGEQR